MNEIQALRYVIKMYGDDAKVISNNKSIDIKKILDEKIEERDLNTLYRKQRRNELTEKSHIFNKKVGNYFRNLRISNNIMLKDVGKIAAVYGIHIKSLQSFEKGDGVSLYKYLVLCHIYNIKGGDAVIDKYQNIDLINNKFLYNKNSSVLNKESIMKDIFNHSKIKESIEMLDCIPKEIRDSLVLKGILRKEKLISEECIKVSLFDILQCVKYLEISPKIYLDQMVDIDCELKKEGSHSLDMKYEIKKKIDK